MAKKLLASILALCLVLSTMSFSVFAAGDSDADNAIARLGDQYYSKISLAIADANAGDTIYVLKDIETLGDISKPVVIEGKLNGVEGAKVTLTGNAGEHQFGTIDGTVTIKNFIYENGNEAVRTDYLSNNYENLNLVISNCDFKNISNYCIMGGSSGNNHVLGSLTVTDCTFTASDASFTSNYMVYAQCVKEVTITNSTFDGKGCFRGAVHLGDSTEYGTNATVSENTIKNYSRGIQVGNRAAEGNSIAISKNIFENIVPCSGDSKTAEECGPVFVHTNADAETFKKFLYMANETTACNDVTIAYENTDDAEAFEEVVVENPVAMIGNNTYYKTLQDASAAATAGDTIEIFVDVTVAENEKITLNGVNLTAGENIKVTNNGVIEVKGECSLNIATLSGNTIDFLDGAIIKDSTVGGGVFVAGNVTFRGDNTFNMLYDYGTLTDYYGTTANMEWTVEEGGSVTLVNKARYGLGYGDNVTVNGSISNALTARDTLTEEDASLFMHGLVGMEAQGWNQNNYLNINNAYVIIGSNNSFGNKPGNNGGTYTYNINNSVVDASRITFYEAISASTFNITNSDVKTGTFMTNDKDSVFTLTNSKVLSTTTTNGTDEGNYNAGTLKLINSDLTYSAPVTNSGTLTVDTDSSLTAPSISGTGTIEIDVSNYDGYGDLSNIINADVSGFSGEVKVVGGDAATVKIVDGKIVIEATPAGGPIYAYTSENTIWGETRANAKESFEIEVYSNDTYMGKTSLNNVDGIINGNVNVTWNIKLDADSNTDEYWTMSWTIAPSMEYQPTHIALLVDGVEVSRNTIQLNGPDNLNKIYAAVTDADGKILSYATSLQNAFDVVKDGETIELLRDVELDKSINYAKDVAITLDGNGKTIKNSNKFKDTIALFDLSNGADITFNNVMFDGVKDVAVMRTVSADVTIDNCVFQNCKHTQIQGLLRLLGDATITNSKFIDNTCTMVVTLCYDGSNGTENFVIDNCVFQNNTCNSTAVVYYADGVKCIVKDSEFIGNNVQSAGNAATLYMGFNGGINATGNLFKDNTVTTTSNTMRVAGGIFAGFADENCKISENVFVNNTATANGKVAASGIAYSAYYAAGNLDGNYWDGNEPVNGVHFTHEYPTENALTVENYYGEYTLDADGNVVLSDAKPVNAKSVSVNFVLNTNESNADESYLVYDIVINSQDGHVINRLNTADLTFEISSSKVSYEITPADKITLTTDADYADRYMFNFKGKDDVEDTATSLIIGQVKLTGYDTFTFGVKNVETNLVTATTVDNNIVDEFKGTGLAISDVINTTINVPTRTLTVNVTFPNAVVDNAADYQTMTVTISGGDLAEDIVTSLGDGKYTVEEELTLNTAYTVTVSGAGYRTARYTVTMTEDKTLNFWNNVMDKAIEVEEGKASSAVIKNFLAGDIVADNDINIYDLSAVVSYFTQEATTANGYVKYDLNRDGVIDSKDVAYVLVSWGE